MSFLSNVLVLFKGKEYYVDFYFLLSWHEEINIRKKLDEEGKEKKYLYLNQNIDSLFDNFDSFLQFSKVRLMLSLNEIREKDLENIFGKITGFKRKSFSGNKSDYKAELNLEDRIIKERKIFWNFPLINKTFYNDILMKIEKEKLEYSFFKAFLFPQKYSINPEIAKKYLISYENTVLKERLENNEEYNFLILLKGSQYETDFNKKVIELIDYFTGGILEVFDVRKCVITGSVICFALTNLLKNMYRKTKYDYVKELKINYPTIYTVFERDVMPKREDYISHEIKDLENGIMILKNESIPFKIVDGVDLDVYFPKNMGDEEFIQEVNLIYEKISSKIKDVILEKNFYDPTNEKGLKFSIKTKNPELRTKFRSIEIYRTNPYQFSTHHLPMVRGCYTALFEGKEEVYFTNTLLLSSLNIPSFYNYFLSKKNSLIDILIKYYLRGYKNLSLDKRINNSLRKKVKEDGIEKGTDKKKPFWESKRIKFYSFIDQLE